MSELRGGSQEELPRVQGQGRRPGGPTPCLRPEAEAGRNNPNSKERWLLQQSTASHCCLPWMRGISSWPLLLTFNV